MANVNVVTIIGNVTRDPELRFTQGGLAVVNFSVASNRRWLNKATNVWDEKVSFFDVTAWQGLGENIAESCRKGDRVIVVGRLEQRSWEDDQGNKRNKIEVVADAVGPSLEWATSTVTKNERREGSDAAPVYAPNEEAF